MYLIREAQQIKTPATTNAFWQRIMALDVDIVIPVPAVWDLTTNHTSASWRLQKQNSNLLHVQLWCCFLFFIGKVLLLWSIKRLPKNPKNTQQYYGTLKCSKHWCFSLSLLSLFIWHVWVSFADPNCSPCQFSNKLYFIHLFIAYGKNITDGNLCK